MPQSQEQINNMIEQVDNALYGGVLSIEDIKRQLGDKEWDEAEIGIIIKIGKERARERMIKERKKSIRSAFLVLIIGGPMLLLLYFAISVGSVSAAIVKGIGLSAIVLVGSVREIISLVKVNKRIKDLE